MFLFIYLFTYLFIYLFKKPGKREGREAFLMRATGLFQALEVYQASMYPFLAGDPRGVLTIQDAQASLVIGLMH